MNNVTINESKTKVIITEEGHETATVIEIPFNEEYVVNSIRNIFSLRVSSENVQNYTEKKPEYGSVVFIRDNSGYRKVLVKDIAHLEAARNYCDIYLVSGKKINVTMPMNEVYEYLNPILFKRVHRSFVINLEHISSYMGNQLTLENGKKITIGREYREKVENEFVCIGSRKRVRERGEK